jgi:hypothetical protein
MLSAGDLFAGMLLFGTAVHGCFGQVRQMASGDAGGILETSLTLVHRDL